MISISLTFDNEGNLINRTEISTGDDREMSRDFSLAQTKAVPMLII